MEVPTVTRPPLLSWEQCPFTQSDLPWADLETIDLSQAQSPEGRARLMPAVRDAMCQNGFMYLINHGLTCEQNSRLLDIADVPFSHVSEDDKMKFRVNPQEDGCWRGYKLRKYFHIDNGVHDQVEMYSVDHAVTTQQHPRALVPFLPELLAFNEVNHNQVLFPILRILALGLELPEETFVDMHVFDGKSSKTWLRFQTYYPYTDEEQTKVKDVWLKGHADVTSVSLLWSQPIAALQILTKEGEWRWVKHIENVLVLNLGEALEMLSGGFYKAAIHRVIQPPPDQRGRVRLGIFYFVVANDNAKLAPLMQSPVLQRMGSRIMRKCSDEEAPTMKELLAARVRVYGSKGALQRREDGTEDQELIKGMYLKHYN